MTKQRKLLKHEVTKAPEFTVSYPTAAECRAISTRLSEMSNYIRGTQGFKGTAAYRAALDLDYLAHLIDADPVKNVSHWTAVIKEAKPQRKKND